MNKQTQAKRKYNKGTYRRYEFSVNLDTKLNYMLEDYKEKGGSISDLIKNCLCEHFGIEQKEIYVPVHFDKNTKTAD